MLGTDLCRLLHARDIPTTAIDRGDLDLLDEDAVSAAVRNHEVVVNCAAWTAVDDAETDEAAAFETNATVPRVLARAVQRHSGRLVHISTDYVFDGAASTPYAEDERVAPRSAYGRTKAAGEEAVRKEAPEQHLIVRTAWLYGAHGGCFPRTIARVARERGAVEVVDDQHGQPTWTMDVADLVVRLVEKDAPPGVWHATSTGQTTWFDFAKRVVAAAGMSEEVVTPTDSSTFTRPAPRPAYSVLGHDRLHEHGIAPIGPWQERWATAASEVLSLDQPE